MAKQPHSKRPSPYLPALLAFAAILGATLACAVGGTPEMSPLQSTAEALSQTIRETATASSGTGFDSAGNVATAEAAGTQQAIDAQATLAALQNLSANDLEATRQAFGPILAELPKYGVDPDKGRPAWIHPEVTLSIDGYLSYDYANQYLGTVVKDFDLRNRN